MQQAEEDLLVLALQNGSHKAFTILFGHYQKPLLRFAYKLCNDQELAMDAVQETWIKLAKSVRQLKDPRAFKSWLYKMVRWRATDLLRQQVRLNSRIDQSKDVTSFVDEQANSNEQDSELNKAIKRLPDVEKQMIHLFYIDELTLVEISIVLDIPVGTVKSRLNRARKLLKQKFEFN